MEKIINRMERVVENRDLRLETEKLAVTKALNALAELMPELIRRYIEYSLVLLENAPADQVRVEHQFALGSHNDSLIRNIEELCSRYREKGVYVYVIENGSLIVSLEEENYW